MATTASDFDFFSTSYAHLSSVLNDYVSTTASTVVAAITPVATQLFTLYVIIYGISMLRGLVEEPITDFAMRTVRMAIILGFALNLGIYNAQVVSFLWNTPDAMAAFVTGTSTTGTSNMTYLDGLMSQFYNLGQQYWAYSSGATSLDIGPKIVSVCIWLAGIVVTAYAAFLLILAKMALAVILGIGPIFILLLMFEGTKRFFEAWLGQALNYVFVVVLTSAAVKLILSLISAYMGNAAAAAATGAVSAAIPPLALGVIGALVLMQLSSVASALGGGVAISTLGAGNAIWSKARGAAGGAKNLASGKTLSDMRAQRRAKVTNANWAAKNPGMTASAAGMSMKAFKKVTSTPNRVKSA